MLNCKNCGAPLSLEDAVCPHCGTPNPEAQEHIHKLIELDAKMDDARQEVKEEVKRSKKGYGLLVILTMLLLANLVVFVLHEASYEIADNIVTSRLSEEDLKAQLDQFLADGEYLEMDIFMGKLSLSYSEYREYLYVAGLAGYYGRLVDCTTQYLYGTDNYSDPLVKACSEMYEFKTEYERLRKRDDLGFAAPAIEAINAEVDLFLKEYYKLTEEDLAGLKDMSSSSIVVLVNERLSNEE